MDELFTESAKAVLAIAQEEAKYFRHQSVGSEHLLLALVLEPNGIAGKTLRQLNTDTEDIREEIEHLSGYGTMQSPMGNNNPMAHNVVGMVKVKMRHKGRQHWIL